MTTPAPLTREQIEQLTDDELRAAYLASSRIVGVPEVEMLIIEMVHRDLDF